MDDLRRVSTATNPDTEAYGFTPDRPVTTIAIPAPPTRPEKPEGLSVVGKSLPKVDAYVKVTGSLKYADDIVLARTVFGRMVRSPHAHARIERVNVERARALPGVVAVVTGDEIPVLYGHLPSSPDETALAIDKVRYVGEPVVAVIAEDELTAEEALELVEVEYEPLDSVMSIEDGLRDDLNKIHEDSRKRANIHKEVHLEFGPVAEGFAGADRIFEDEYFFDGNTHAPLEQHSVLANCELDGKITIWSSTQNPHYLHRVMASVLGMPASRLRIVACPVGGGFGAKTDVFNHEVVAAYASRKLGRPVKFTLTREEVFYAHRGRHPVLMKLRTGVLRDGTITAVKLDTWLDGGAFSSYGVASTYYTGALLPVTYKIPAFTFNGVRVFTNKPPCGPKRGHGTPQPRFAFECQLDKIADELGLDAAEYRRRIAVEPYSTTANQLRITSCGLDQCIEAVNTRGGYSAKHGKLPYGKGIGIAASAYITGAGMPIYRNAMPHSGAIVKVDRSGGVTVFCGVSDCGQGSTHMLATVVAEALGVDIMDVQVFMADTDLTPVDLGSYSSRVTFMAGNAARYAAESVREKLAAVAGPKLGIPPERCGFARRRVFDRDDPGHGLPLLEVFQLAEAHYGTLAGVGSYTPPEGIKGDFKGAGVGPSPAYTYSACVAEVDVDAETGEVRVERIVLAHDCGRALNPAVVEGQIEGSVYMALGEILMERSEYRGDLHKYPNLLDYKTLMSVDMPVIETIIIETDDIEGPYGAKEVGQGALLPVIPAVANAVADAVGVRINANPLTPWAVLKALEEKRTARKAGHASGAASREGAELP